MHDAGAENRATVQDWNAVATVHEEGFAEARRILRRFGRVARTRYYNVLAITAEDPGRLLTDFARLVEEAPGTLNFISHLFPAQHCLDFRDAEEFEASSAGSCWTGSRRWPARPFTSA
jgi:hypothetical protein